MSTLPPGLGPAPPVLTFSLHSKFEQGLEVLPSPPCRLQGPPLSAPPEARPAGCASVRLGCAPASPACSAVTVPPEKAPDGGNNNGRQEVRGRCAPLAVLCESAPAPGADERRAAAGARAGRCRRGESGGGARRRAAAAGWRWRKVRGRRRVCHPDPPPPWLPRPAPGGTV